MSADTAALAVFDSEAVTGTVDIVCDVAVERQLFTLIDVDLCGLQPSRLYSLHMHASGDTRAPKCSRQRIGPTVTTWRPPIRGGGVGFRRAFSNALVPEMRADAGGRLKGHFLIDDQQHTLAPLDNLFGRSLALHDNRGSLIDCEPVGCSQRSATLKRLLHRQALIYAARLSCK